MTELHRTALLGLNRANWARASEGSSESDFLKVLAREAVEGKAGWQASPLAESEQAPCPEAEDESAWMGLEAASCLEALLSGKRMPLLIELLSLAEEKQKLVRPIHLPKLLAIAIQRSMDEEKILKVVGERGRWLAGQHPQWKKLLPPVESDWKTGHVNQRKRYLRLLRQKDPAAGRKLLEPLVQKRAHSQLERLLPELSHGLSKEDLPLLEPLKGVRMKGLRQKSLSLMGAIQESSLAKEAQPLAKRCLRMEGGEMVVDLPQSDNFPLLNDYLPMAPEENVSFRVHSGGRSQLLMKLIVLMPLEEWEDHLGEPPEKLIRKLPDHIWGEVLFKSWTIAAWQQKNERWAIQLLRLVLYPKYDPALRGETGYERWLPGEWRPVLLALVPQGERNRLLRAAMPYVESHSAFPMPFALIGQVPRPVDVSVALAFAKRLMDLLQVNENRLTKDVRSLVQQLPAIAHRLPVGAHGELLSIWASNPNYSLWFDPYLQGALQVIAFRRRMAQAFP